MQKLTLLEREMIRRIINSEYQNDSDNPIDYPIWIFSVAETKADGGVLTSLNLKGFVRISSYEKKSDCVSLTQAGFDAYTAEVQNNVE